ncbi:hypothetical protein AMELA_G00195400 [Ameiurus melas]|uniref:Uncharacterized protein n=1 Tax=Ameiurus melas TaxID=219545 RepID=A0A7J6A5R9_AMEME|nr:hypothetical protein AMELA_G00195400 [Ameiurus melas]
MNCNPAHAQRQSPPPHAPHSATINRSESGRWRSIESEQRHRLPDNSIGRNRCAETDQVQLIQFVWLQPRPGTLN